MYLEHHHRNISQLHFSNWNRHLSLGVEDIKANNTRSLGALCALMSQMPGRNALFMCLFMSHTFTNEQQQHYEGSSKLYVEVGICPAGLQRKVSNEGNQEQCTQTCVKRGKYWEEQILPIYWLWRQKSLFLTGTNWKGVWSIFTAAHSSEISTVKAKSMGQHYICHSFWA